MLIHAVMSADVNRNIVINARGEGAMWFILKPVIAEDFRYMWQYVLRWQNEIREEVTQLFYLFILLIFMCLERTYMAA